MPFYPEIAGIYLPLLDEAIIYLRDLAHRSDARGDSFDFNALNEISNFLVRVSQLLHAVDEDLE